MSEEPIIINFEEAGENGGPVELNSTETKSNQIIIYSIYGRRRYELNLNFEDFEKYQFPRAVLNRAAFTDMIMAKKFDVKFNNKNKVIIINITLFADYYIELILIESKKFIFPMEERIAELEKEVAILRKFKQDNDPQLIHSFDYPQWHGEDEFKRLPHYYYLNKGIKLADKSWNEKKITVSSIDIYPLEISWNDITLCAVPCDSHGYLYSFINTIKIFRSNYNYIDNQDKLGYALSTSYKGENELSVTDAQYKRNFEERDARDQVIKHHPFFKSMTVEDYSKNYKIHSYTFNFISIYLTMWVLEKYNKFLPHKLKAVVEINGNKIKVNVFKLKEKIQIYNFYKNQNKESLLILNFPMDLYCNGVQL